MDVPAPIEIPLSEIRDYFTCPYIWWFRNEPLALEHQEQLMRLKAEPGMLRVRMLPLEIQKHRLLMFSIASAIAAGITWITSAVFTTGPIERVTLPLNIIGYCFAIPALYGIVRWWRWRQRTPGYDRAMPGEIVYRDAEVLAKRTFRAAQYGLTGTLDCVLLYKKKLAHAEYRTLEAPRFLYIQDRMQAVAQALMVEAEFGQRPQYAYVVYPDWTFEVRIVPAEVEQLLSGLRVIIAGKRDGRIPDAPPVWHLCPACPLTMCPKRIAPDSDQPESA